MTQAQRTLDYIDKNGSITYRQMERDLEINSPRDIIRQLKKDGFPIETARITYTKRSGEKSFYHEFTLKEGD